MTPTNGTSPEVPVWGPSDPPGAPRGRRIEEEPGWSRYFAWIPFQPHPDVEVEPLAWRMSSPVAATAATLAADVVALSAAAALALVLRSVLWGFVPLPNAFAVAATLWFALRAHAGIYPGYGISAPEELRRSTTTTAVAALVNASLLFATQQAYASRIATIGPWLLVLPLTWTLRAVTRDLLIRRRLFGRPVVVIGAGDKGARAVREMHANPRLGLVPVAIFSDNHQQIGQRLEGVPIVGVSTAAADWRFPYPVSHAMLALSYAEADGKRLLSITRQLASRYPTIDLFPDLHGLANLWAQTRAVGPYLALTLQHDRFCTKSRIMKRAFDLALGLPLFIASIPTIAVAAFAVWMIDRAFPFYSQTREGRNGRTIRIWKIRSMTRDAEATLGTYLSTNPEARREWETTLKLRHDPRVLRGIGAFLRSSSIDELPQLWSVVVGDISLVGPRVFPQYHLDRFAPDFRSLRRQVAPGVTGLWQVNHRSESDLRVQEIADTYYIHNWSLWLDLWILLRTVKVVAARTGAY